MLNYMTYKMEVSGDVITYFKYMLQILLYFYDLLRVIYINNSYGGFYRYVKLMG
jgi:hypothetical protein